MKVLQRLFIDEGKGYLKMIKFEKTEVFGWEAAIRGMRNPMNSWDKSDSMFYANGNPDEGCDHRCESCRDFPNKDCSYVGPNDYDLMTRLRNAGTDHRKFMRMITVYVDITAPLYWWKEFDTYKVGTVANSCSTMHKIAEKEFTIDDFSNEHLVDVKGYPHGDPIISLDGPSVHGIEPYGILNCYIIPMLNRCRDLYNATKYKMYWWQMIQLLPASYNQKRTVMMNYEVLANIYKSRKDHKLDEWREGFCDWIRQLPYSELITGEIK